jgi:glutamate-5-semialdehyde dehydrogenase
MTVAVAGSLDDAIGPVNRFGSGHTEAIVTRPRCGARLTGDIDAAVVIVGTSTRFTDGGASVSGPRSGSRPRSSTPVADEPRELTTYKYVLWGDGQVVE